MSDPAIVVRRLSKRFGETEVLHDIDLEVVQGEATCVIGPSGSGKSTLLRCLAFLEEAERGNDRGLTASRSASPRTRSGRRKRLPSQRIRAVRAQIGMVFQQFNLWPHMTALGNVSEALKTVRRLPSAEGRGARDGATAQNRAWRTAPATIPRSFPAASSNASQSPARSRWSRRSCCSTRRPRRSIPN